MDSEIRSLQARVRTLKRKCAPQLAFVRLRTFMAVHNYLDRCRKDDTFPEVRHILLALLPFDWERINYHMPKNSDFSDLDEEARDRFWKEWLASAG